MQQTVINHELAAPTSPHQAGDHPDVLLAVTDPCVNLSLWQRPPQTAIIRELQGLQGSQLRDVRRPTSLSSFDNDVSTLLQQQGLDPLDFKNLRADLHRLAGILARVSQDGEFTFRLLTTDRDDCRRFHLDRIRLRLICTYRGPGTEWLTDAQVDRVALANGAPNESIIRFGEPSHIEAFWVGILKGDPANVGQGLVHRSPPVEDSGQVRVLFCLDC